MARYPDGNCSNDPARRCRTRRTPRASALWPPSSTAGGTRTAFTLIELLVVIAILVLLLTLLMPTFRNAREHARLTVCANNLSHCGQGVETYVFDNHQRYPAAYTHIWQTDSWDGYDTADPSWPRLGQGWSINKTAGRYVSPNAVNITRTDNTLVEVPFWVCPNAAEHGQNFGSYSPSARFGYLIQAAVADAADRNDTSKWIPGPRFRWHRRGDGPLHYQAWRGPELTRALLLEAYIGFWPIKAAGEDWSLRPRHLGGMNVLQAGGNVVFCPRNPDAGTNVYGDFYTDELYPDAQYY